MKFAALLLAGLAGALLAAGLAFLILAALARRRHPERGGPRYREYRRSLGDRK